MTTPARNLPPPLPPRKPPGVPQAPIGDPPALSYFVPPPPIGWAVIGLFSASEWHSARVLLAQRNIVARIGNSVDETGHTVELLVPVGNQAYARSLLAAGVHAVEEVQQGPGGFPVSLSDEPPFASVVPFAHPVDPGLTPRQILNYNIILVFLWLALIFVLILTGLALLLPD